MRLHKIVTHSPFLALRYLIHAFSLWAFSGAAFLLHRIVAGPDSLEELRIYHGNFEIFATHILASVLVLLAFSCVLHRCIKENSDASEP